MWNPQGSERGQGLVEYALILVLIAIVVIAILTLTGSQLNTIFARIVLQIQYPGNYSGDPVEVTSMNVTATGGPAGTTASATVGLSGATGSPDICVQFNDSQHGSKIDCSPDPRAEFPGGGSGTVEACVIGVEGHSLSGGPYCGSDSY